MDREEEVTVDPPERGELIAGRYRIEDALSQGSQGALMGAHDELLNRRVAIRILHGIREPAKTKRFMREARTVARLQSEHIVQVLDMGTHTGIPFIVLERLEGKDLVGVVEAEGPLPIARAADYVIQACEGLAHAHAQDIVHRDLKPSNLFVAKQADGSTIVKVLDFGIAKAHSTKDERLTETNAFLGSPSFMSPEQIKQPHLVDARADVWSLGVVLFALISGQRPFTGGSLGEVMSMICGGSPRTLAEVGTTAPPELEAILKRCFERKPSDRFATVLDLATALAPFARTPKSAVEKIAYVLSADPPTAKREGAPAVGPAPAPFPARETTLVMQSRPPRVPLAPATPSKLTPLIARVVLFLAALAAIGAWIAHVRKKDEAVSPDRGARAIMVQPVTSAPTTSVPAAIAATPSDMPPGAPPPSEPDTTPLGSSSARASASSKTRPPKPKPTGSKNEFGDRL